MPGDFSSLRASRSRVIGIRMEQLLTADLVIGDIVLSIKRDQIVDELLTHPLLYVRMLCRVYRKRPTEAVLT
jgi:hypothetical protein